MKTFIWRHFVKDFENYKDPLVRSRYTKLTGTLGILVNTILCVVKIILGLAINSIAVLADGIHDMADCIAACITLIGSRLSRKPADSSHPFGHARIEYLASLVVSCIILVVGYELLRASISKCMAPEETLFSWYMVAFMIFAILLKGSAALFIIATGKHIGSLPVIAAGTDNRNDVITSIIIVIGMLTHHYTGLQLDGYMGILVSLFILYSGFMLIRETIDPLLGSSPEDDTVEQMRQIILGHPEVLGIHDMIIYNYGPGRSFATFHAEVDADADLVEIHDVIDHIEREIERKLKINVTCHMDPVKTGDPEQILISKVVGSALAHLPAVSDYHDLRIVRDQGKRIVKVDVVIPPGEAYDRQEILDAVSQRVHEIDEAYQVVINFDQEYTVS